MADEKQKPTFNEAAKQNRQAPKYRFTKSEVAAHRMVVERLRKMGMTAPAMQRQMRTGIPDIGFPPTRLSRTRIEKHIEDITNEWIADQEKNREGNKASQVQRLYDLRARTMNAKDFKTVVAVEREIAKLEGNYAPLRIEAEVVQTHALKVVVGSMKDDQLIEQYQRAKAAFAALEEKKASAMIVEHVSDDEEEQTAS